MRGKKNTVTENKKVSPKTSRAAKQEKKTLKQETKSLKQEQKSLGKLWVLIVILFGALIGYQQKEIHDLKQANGTLKANVQQNMAQLKKVYVYNLEETLKGIKLESLNREFEEKLKVLNEEVSIAQEKISSLKDSKDKDTFSDIYLKSLKLKRDTMIQGYNRSLEDLTEQVNQAISEIAKEKKASVILDVRAVASLTENVEDVTEEVIKRVKLQRPQAMDE